MPHKRKPRSKRRGPANFIKNSASVVRSEIADDFLKYPQEFKSDHQEYSLHIPMLFTPLKILLFMALLQNVLALQPDKSVEDSSTDVDISQKIIDRSKPKLFEEHIVISEQDTGQLTASPLAKTQKALTFPEPDIQKSTISKEKETRKISLAELMAQASRLQNVEIVSSLLYEFAGVGDTDALNTLLEQQTVDANMFMTEQRCALHKAIEMQQHDAIRVLLEHYINPDANYLDNSPLYLAITLSDIETVKLLLEFGADPNLQQPALFSPLVLAAESGNLEIVKQLVSVGALVNLPAIEAAQKKEHTAVVNFLEKTRNEQQTGIIGARKHYKPNTTPTNKLIHLATFDKDVEAIRQFNKQGHDINAYDTKGMTPLIFSIVNRDEPTFSALLEIGADVNKLTTTGHSPLGQAIIIGSSFMVEQLLNYGAQYKQKEQWGGLPLVLAARKNFSEITQLFLTPPYNYGINEADDMGITALLAAVNNNNLPLLRDLLDAGADIQESQVLRIARTLGFSEIENFLENRLTRRKAITSGDIKCSQTSRVSPAWNDSLLIFILATVALGLPLGIIYCHIKRTNMEQKKRKFLMKEAICRALEIKRKAKWQQNQQKISRSQQKKPAINTKQEYDSNYSTSQDETLFSEESHRSATLLLEKINNKRNGLLEALSTRKKELFTALSHHSSGDELHHQATQWYVLEATKISNLYHRALAITTNGYSTSALVDLEYYRDELDFRELAMLTGFNALKNKIAEAIPLSRTSRKNINPKEEKHDEKPVVKAKAKIKKPFFEKKYTIPKKEHEYKKIISRPTNKTPARSSTGISSAKVENQKKIITYGIKLISNLNKNQSLFKRCPIILKLAAQAVLLVVAHPLSFYASHHSTTQKNLTTLRDNLIHRQGIMDGIKVSELITTLNIFSTELENWVKSGSYAFTQDWLQGISNSLLKNLMSRPTIVEDALKSVPSLEPMDILSLRNTIFQHASNMSHLNGEIAKIFQCAYDFLCAICSQALWESDINLFENLKIQAMWQRGNLVRHLIYEESYLIQLFEPSSIYPSALFYNTEENSPHILATFKASFDIKSKSKNKEYYGDEDKKLRAPQQGSLFYSKNTNSPAELKKEFAPAHSSEVSSSSTSLTQGGDYTVH